MIFRRPRPSRALAWAWLAGSALASMQPAHAADTDPTQQLTRFESAAGAPGLAERGRQFFIDRHGGRWACASCHGERPLAPGRHASTGKTIEPLAPAANAQAFTSMAKVDKWFRRNCGDVLQRDCSAAEKADVLAYLLSLKR